MSSSKGQDEQIHLLSTPHPDDEEATELSKVEEPTTNNNTTLNVEQEEEEEEETLEDYAGMVVTIFQPVAITMLFVVWAVRTINVNQLGGASVTMVYVEDEEDSTGEKLLGSIVNALIFLAIIIATTVLFVILYKYRCLKIIYAWLGFSTCSLLGAFGGYLFYLLLEAGNLALDYITFSLLVWNFAVVGIVAIFLYSPQKINQGYLVIISGLLAIYFTRLPEWTTWAILAIVAVYDLFAVLCPRGPLKVLVETAQERKEPIPALLYNASVTMMMAHNDNDLVDQPLDDDEPSAADAGVSANPADAPTSTQQQNEVIQSSEQQGGPVLQEENKGKGVKLGLGDFVFYSVLMGRAALFDMLTVFTCFIGIITGLFATLLLLAVYRKALPALPISIAFGIIFFFLSKVVLYPFVYSMGAAQIFV